jgi:hypothetical protein
MKTGRSDPVQHDPSAGTDWAMVSFVMRSGDAVTRRRGQGSCIYCGAIRYRDKDDRKLGEEHVIAEGLGGTLVLPSAACEDCERRINAYEQSILKTVLYAPRVHLGIRRKRRKRAEEAVKVQGQVNGKDVDIILPLKNVPVLLFLLKLGPPGILVGRPIDIPDIDGVWISHLSSGSPVPPGFSSFASPVLDTFKFCQFLAKIAHCYAIEVFGADFEPLLKELIREPARAARYDLVGGAPTVEPPSENLHELDLTSQKSGATNYVIVKIRLFANLGAPSYLVVAGTTKTNSLPSQTGHE